MFRLQKNCSDPFFGPFILQVIQKHNCTEAKTIFCFEKIAEYLIYGSSLVFDFTGSMELQPCKSSESVWQDCGSFKSGPNFSSSSGVASLIELKS